MVIKSFAKLNLYLRVKNKRSDNFHNLETLFERISLQDRIVIANRRDNLIKLSCNNVSCPTDSANICWKAARLLQDKFCVKTGLNIKIIKRIPVGAGLGGGSSNAAALLLGLNKLWRLNLNQAKLVKLAAELGSDVAFFVYDTSFAVGRGRGEKIRILSNLKKIKLWHILVVPKIHVSTPLIYKKFDAFSGLTKPRSNVKILTSALAKNASTFEPGLLFNSLEAVTLKLYPEVKRIKERLSASGLKNILMSGSGSAVFAVCYSFAQAQALSKRFKREEKSWRVFVVRTA
ncbi:MAG: 4-(cytidine 5'-diphospho)-2-C-methyl-D-erythritol kinase [Candidatus Omnitrophica bacterium]|nr:4-(cytidine 5'-diphospho)-2-C-methyl-D-erythritol kinase [Candidatus Omnitrophota bacterium]